MDLTRFLLDNSAAVIKRATEAVGRLSRGNAEPDSSRRTCLQTETLYFLIVRSLPENNVGPLVRYVESDARERVLSSRGIDEIQNELDILWDAIRREASARVGPVEFAEVSARVGRTLNKAREALSRTYFALSRNTWRHSA
jgi:hypothetical protein